MTYVDPAGKPYAHLDRLVAWQKGERPGPVTLEWDLSNRCVLGCQDCHFAYTHVRGPWAGQARVLPMAQDRGGDLADTDLVKRTIRQATTLGVKGIIWTGGGEPTTHPDWTEIIDYAYLWELDQGMYTLGGLLTKETGRHLAERASWVVVSLDAVSAGHYAAEKRVHESRFEAALNGIRSLVGYKAVVGVSYLLHAENWRYAWDMVRLTRSLGATYTTLRPTVQTTPLNPGQPIGSREWVWDALDLLADVSNESDVECSPGRFGEYAAWQRHPYPVCYGIRLNATITPDGRVWVCPNRREFPHSCLGDLRQETFRAIWDRHPGRWDDFAGCRAMCRLHPVNKTLAQIYSPRKHDAFI